MALNANALCSVAQVREFLQKPGEDTQQDDAIESLINRASAAIERWTEREFTPTTSATRTFVYEGGGVLDLVPYELRTVTTLKIDRQTDSPTTLTTTDYKLRPKPNRDGTYQWVTLPTRTSETEVEIVGNWGMTAVPDDVEHACIITVATWLRRDVSAFSTTFSIEEERLERPEALPSSARATLSPYCRRVAL